MERKRKKTPYSLKKKILFAVDSDIQNMILELQYFYRFRSRNKLFPHIIMMAVLYVARFRKNKNWTERQLKAWNYCKEKARIFDEAVVLVAAGSVVKKLKKETPNAKLTVPQFGKKIRREIKHACTQKNS